MTNTVNMLKLLVLVAALTAMFTAWIFFWFNRSDGRPWGFAVAMSPIPVALLAYSAWQDLA